MMEFISKEERNELVYSMFDEGLTSDEICEQTGLTKLVVSGIKSRYKYLKEISVQVEDTSIKSDKGKIKTTRIVEDKTEYYKVSDLPFEVDKTKVPSSTIKTFNGEDYISLFGMRFFTIDKKFKDVEFEKWLKELMFGKEKPHEKYSCMIQSLQYMVGLIAEKDSLYKTIGSFDKIKGDMAHFHENTEDMTDEEILAFHKYMKELYDKRRNMKQEYLIADALHTNICKKGVRKVELNNVIKTIEVVLEGNYNERAKGEDYEKTGIKKFELGIDKDIE